MSSIFRRSLAQKIKTAVAKSPVQSLNISLREKNEPILEYKRGSQERKDIEAALIKMSSECPEIPVLIGKEKLSTNNKVTQVMPHNHSKGIAIYNQASKDNINQAAKEAICAQEKWRQVTIEDKIQIWQKAANLMAGKYRQEINAAIMLGQSKTVIQAEIDTVELIDFIRFGAEYLEIISQYKPLSVNPQVSLNTYHLRPLDGFVAAITPFNFTAIGGNLAFTPTLLGNCTLWKPSSTAVLSNWIVYKIMQEAGLPPGVVSFLPSKASDFGEGITASPHFAGLNFTGSVPTFRKLWVMIANNLDKYSCFPRMVGECGGKNYHFVHPSADVESVVSLTIRAAFEYSGQKCSACSRLYVPESLWGCIQELLLKALTDIKVGDVCDFSVFTSSVIDLKAFERITEYLKKAKNNSNLKIIAGGASDCAVGYFIQPTIIKTNDACDKLMTEEIFGPVLTVYVYKDNNMMETLKTMGISTDYALTGAIFAKDKKFIEEATEILRMSAGNFYINDKCTGSIVAQQPFGGARLSGTNDKAGSMQFLQRWASPQIIKETFVPITDIKYPYMC